VETVVAQLGNMNALQDALLRRAPALLQQLSARWPELGLTAKSTRTLGAAADPVTGAVSPSPNAVQELAEAGLVEARADLSEVLDTLGRRSRRLALLKLLSSTVALLSTGGLLALLLANTAGGAGSSFTHTVTAAVAFGSSCLSLVGVYLEDFSGGEGSTKKLRDLANTLVRNLSDVEGSMRLARALQQSDAYLSIVQSLNSLLAELQFARAQLGLPI